MQSPEELAQIKAWLIEAWEQFDRPPEEEISGVRPQAIGPLPPPRKGLAIGHSTDPETGRPRIELRVTASKGRAREQARAIRDKAQAQGFDAVLRFFRPPKIPPAKAYPILPSMGGRRRPLSLGASVAHERASAGTLGAFVEIEDGTGILSCVHVLALANGRPARRGDPIQQPGVPDPVPQSNRIATLTGYFAPFVREQKNNLDAAVALLHPNVEHLGNRIPDDPKIPEAYRGRAIGTPLETDELKLNTPVCKVGRTTGFTTATLASINFENLAVQFGSETAGGPFFFSGVHEIRWEKDGIFTAGGDSGALVMTLDGLHPIGINFCALSGGEGVTVSYIVPWSRIRDIYGIKLL